MFIDEIYQEAHVILNKDQQGKFTPTEFNKVLPEIIMNIWTDYFPDSRKLINKKINYRSGVNLSQEQHFKNQLLEFYIVPNVATNVTGGTFIFPKKHLKYHLAYIHTMVDDKGNIIEKVDYATMQLHNSNNKYTSSSCYPEYSLTGDIITISPNTINNVKATYIRYPLTPKWTYRIVNGKEMFDDSASDFQDIDMHFSQKSRILYELCQRFGVTLREAEVVQSMAGMETNDYNKEQSA